MKKDRQADDRYCGKGKMDREIKRLAEILRDGNYHTAKELAAQTGVSEKTVRLRLKSMQYMLRACAEVESKARYGYRLLLTDEAVYREKTDPVKSCGFTPESAGERVDYLLHRLIDSRDYLRLDDLAEEMYISRNTISLDMKKVEQILSDFGLSLKRRPGYGISLQGRETARRRLMVYCGGREIQIGPESVTKETMARIGDRLKALVNRYDLEFTEFNFQNIVLHLYISYKRIEKGFILSDGIGDVEIDEEILHMVRELTDDLSVLLQITYTDAEIRYIALHFMGKQSLHGSGVTGNFVVPPEIIGLVDEMIEEIRQLFKMDFRQNLELKLRLYEHLVPLDIRLRFGLQLRNPLLAYVRAEYPLPYMVAECACKVLGRRYERELSCDEVSYIAILFALAMEYFENISRKKRILLVCNSGKVTAQLIALRYQKEFSPYIDSIDVCNLETLKKQNMKKWDVIFATVPIRFSVPLPVINIPLSLNDKDVEQVRNLLRRQDGGYMNYYYREELFFTHIAAESREQVIRDICEATGETIALPEGFYESVQKREDMMSTAYGYRCALLHPWFMSTDFSFASVAVLKEPVRWGSGVTGAPRYVQVVFLISLAEDELYCIQEFYEAITELVLSKERVERLIGTPSMEVLREIYMGH